MADRSTSARALALCLVLVVAALAILGVSARAVQRRR